MTPDASCTIQDSPAIIAEAQIRKRPVLSVTGRQRMVCTAGGAWQMRTCRNQSVVHVILTDRPVYPWAHDAEDRCYRCCAAVHIRHARINSSDLTYATCCSARGLPDA